MMEVFSQNCDLEKYPPHFTQQGQHNITVRDDNPSFHAAENWMGWQSDMDR